MPKSVKLEMSNVMIADLENLETSLEKDAMPVNEDADYVAEESVNEEEGLSFAKLQNHITQMHPRNPEGKVFSICSDIGEY